MFRVWLVNEILFHNLLTNKFCMGNTVVQIVFCSRILRFWKEYTDHLLVLAGRANRYGFQNYNTEQENPKVILFIPVFGYVAATVTFVLL